MKWPDDFVNKVICGDCLGVMKEIPDESIDCIITDPPYGIRITEQKIGGTKKNPNSRFYRGNWDKRLNKIYFEEIFRISKYQIIFGGNYYLDYLPSNGNWLVWDKRCGIIPERSFADGELIWTNINTRLRIFRYIWDGFLQQDMKDREERVHPTQKPIALMSWLIKKFTKENDLILDPFAGSGSTLVAAKRLGRRFIGIEREEEYIKIAEKRLAQEVLIFNNPNT